MSERRELIRRPTALGLAFVELYGQMGFDTSNARMPMKREPVWSVTRRKKG